MDFTNTLREILNARGIGVLENEKLFIALLMDLCPKGKKEREMITIFYREGIMEQIKVFLFRSPEEKSKYSEEVYMKLKQGVYKDNESFLQMYNAFLSGIGWSTIEINQPVQKPSEQVKTNQKIPVIGNDMTREILISPREAIAGCMKIIQVGKKMVKFNVPAGAYDKQQIVLCGEGTAGLNGGKNGDLYIRFKVEKEQYKQDFAIQSIDGKDIEIDLFITRAEIRQNNIRKFSTNGKVFEVKIPEDIKDGQKILVKGHGEEGVNGGRNGDFYLCINMPKIFKLEKEESKGFFAKRLKKNRK